MISAISCSNFIAGDQEAEGDALPIHAQGKILEKDFGASTQGKFSLEVLDRTKNVAFRTQLLNVSIEKRTAGGMAIAV